MRPIRLRTVLGGTPQSQQWNAFIARYHYLGYQTLVGAQMRYTVHDRHGGLLALLGFSTAARKLAPRDRFIGWTPALREKNLPRVIDNARFLILPWITIPNLASHILSAAGRQLPPDATAGTRNTISRKRPSGCALSEKTGNESSTSRNGRSSLALQSR